MKVLDGKPSHTSQRPTILTLLALPGPFQRLQAFNVLAVTLVRAAAARVPSGRRSVTPEDVADASVVEDPVVAADMHVQQGIAPSTGNEGVATKVDEAVRSFQRTDSRYPATCQRAIRSPSVFLARHGGTWNAHSLDPLA